MQTCTRSPPARGDAGIPRAWVIPWHAVSGKSGQDRNRGGERDEPLGRRTPLLPVPRGAVQRSSPLPRGKTDPAFRTKLSMAVELVHRTVDTVILAVEAVRHHGTEGNPGVDCMLDQPPRKVGRSSVKDCAASPYTIARSSAADWAAAQPYAAHNFRWRASRRQPSCRSDFD